MNRRAVALAGIGAVLLLLAWYFVLWSPRSSALDDARDRKDVAEQRNQQLEASIERLRKEQQNEPQRRANLERLRAAIPDQPNLAQFILDTNDAAVKAGIDFISIAPTPPAAPAAVAAPTTTTTAPQAGSGVGAGAGAGSSSSTTAGAPAEIKLTLQIAGGYFQVLDFLNRLGDMPRVVVVDGLNLTADQSARLTASVTARMFVQPGAVATDGTTTTTTSTTAPAAGGATTTTAAGGATTTTVAGGATTSTTGAQP